MKLVYLAYLVYLVGLVCLVDSRVRPSDDIDASSNLACLTSLGMAPVLVPLRPSNEHRDRPSYPRSIFSLLIKKRPALVWNTGAAIRTG
jgi:hypothetical protein